MSVLNGENIAVKLWLRVKKVTKQKAHYRELDPNRMNVVGIIKGKGNGRSLILNGHTDTVDIKGMEIEPLNPKLRDGKVYGRGSLDMKGGLTAMMMVADVITTSKLKLNGDVVLQFVADEEYASIGTETLAKEYTADAAIVCEPTDLKIAIAHKGFVWAKIEVYGKAAHGGRPDEGIDAITKAGKFLVALEDYGNNILSKNNHLLLGTPSVHASLISGGREMSTYPDYCKIDIERRMLPGETLNAVKAEIDTIINNISEKDKDFKAIYDIFFHRHPLETSTKEAIYKSLLASYKKIVGKKPDTIGLSGWGDSALLSEVGIPTLNFGPGGSGLHSSIEYVDFQSVLDTIAILTDTIINFCN